ncbi:hypothetical protein VXQ18_03200 [Brucella abortus]|nr:hypothetical protein [Brucella abortus]
MRLYLDSLRQFCFDLSGDWGSKIVEGENWIFGAAALFVLAKVFGNDKPSPVPPSIPVAPQAATQPAEQAPQPLGFIQATSPRQTDQPPPEVYQHPFIGKWLYSTAKG